MADFRYPYGMKWPINSMVEGSFMRRLLTSCFGLGFMPIAPGTWGSMPVAVLFGLLCYMSVSATVMSLVLVLVAVGASAVCVLFAPAAIEATGKKDPGEVVADETAGQAIAFIGAFPAGITAIAATAVIGFLAFRLLDIIKPFPCRRLEALPAGWGILADDLMAGVY
ncbi:MAG: phosphatidylglycerophosphatase A, partial [Planctomycetes bacterium]|nr:phosphatidylglycerophosphatase A [Planctomycetota bacterium]